MGAVNSEPAPQLSLARDHNELGSRPARQLGHWQKVELVNRGGGQNVKWSVSGADEVVQLTFTVK